MPLAISGANNTLHLSNPTNVSLGFPLPGCVAPLVRVDEIHTYATRSVFDNFNIQHQIPRSSKQYAWITASLDSILK